MSSILDKKFSILERKSSAIRMRDRDTAGGRIDPDVKHKKHKKSKEHYRKNWDKDLWE